MSTILKRSALSFLTASTLFLWIPLYVVYLALSDVNFSIKEFFFFSIALTAVASIVLFVASTVLTWLRLNWLASGIFYFIIFWTCLSGLLLPLAGQAGMASPEDLPINYRNLVIVGSLALILTLLTYTKIKPATQAFVLILLSTSLGSAAYTLIETGASMDRFSGLSKNDNVIVLSFDGVAGNVAKQVIEEHPDLKAAFKDLIFYDNAISIAPATEASLRSEIYGNMDFRALSTLSGELNNKLSKKTNSIKREQLASSDVMTYGVYSTFNDTLPDVIIPGTLIDNSFGEQASIALSFYPHIAARIGSPVLAKFVADELRTVKQTYLQDSKAERTLVHQGAPWDAQNTLQRDDLVALTQNLHVTNSRRTVRFMHFLHTHFPVDFDESCTYRSDSAEWFNSNQNYQGLLNETYCALQQTATYIEKLKALGVYDQTTLIVKSDHGAPANYFESDPDGITFNDHPLWGYNRYRPLLMIKAPSSVNDSIIYNSELSSLTDLARTLCLHAPSNSQCNEYTGVDLLSATPQHDDNKLYLDVVKDQTSSFDFDTQMTVSIPRDNDFLSALKSTGAITFRASEMTRYEQRLRDLAEIRDALEKYHQAKGSYPLSQGFDGLYSIWGRSAADWIPGLAPTFIKKLPRDPELSQEKTPQYIYRSNGAGYKLLAHGAYASCMIASRLNPELLDPLRKCFAFGYWSEGAQGW
jgi:hypothetical protein